jgi:hypothetical protein
VRSRVPLMYPRRTRVLYDQTTRNAYLQGFFFKPSDGLEPSTPSLPSLFGASDLRPIAAVCNHGLHKGSILCCLV